MLMKRRRKRKTSGEETSADVTNVPELGTEGTDKNLEEMDASATRIGTKESTAPSS
jgi:hypothetical protein